MIKFFKLIASILILIVLACSSEVNKPTLFTIGDSTVKCGAGDGAQGLWGWGAPIIQFFDTTKINVENHARGGTSSRTYRTLGLWEPVLEQIKKGDFVLMQFGHNDNNALNDSSRARGTIHGIGNESEEIDNILTGKHEVVHSYGWYMRQYIKEIKASGGIPIILSPIPRNDWIEGSVPLNNDTYGLWAKQVAEQEGILFIDLNTKMALAMEELGEENVTDVLFFSRDHTHTTADGAVLAATKIVEGIREIPECGLNKFLLEDPLIEFPVK